MLAHLETIDIPGAEPQPEDGPADDAACGDLVAVLERLAGESASVEMRTIGQSENGEPIRVVEFSGGGETTLETGDTLGILLPCGLGGETLDSALHGNIDELDLDDDEFDRLDLVLVPRADALQENP